jgi:hypothetical protein
MTTPLLKITGVNHEQAYRRQAELLDQTVFETSSMTIFSGNHPLLGWIYIIIPPLGEALLVPFAIQSSVS